MERIAHSPDNNVPILRNHRPYGNSLWHEVWQRDNTTSFVKALCVGTTAFSLLGLMCLPSIGVGLGLVDGTWDDVREIKGSWDLLSHPDALGIPRETLRSLAKATVATYLAIIAADITLGNKYCRNGTRIDIHWPYPKFWKTDNTKCYDEMFSEPSRWGRLLRRPGNALSNAIYLFSSLCAFRSSCWAHTKTNDDNNPFWLADAGFACMLLLLAIFSTTWHCSNAPVSQYFDLWSMDSCIFFFVIRYACVGLLYYWLTFQSNSDDGSNRAARGAGIWCAVAYAALVVVLGRFYCRAHSKGWLHGRCPFSGRARLEGRSDVFMQGHKQFTIAALCTFQALPIVYVSLPAAIIFGLMKGKVSGSIMACSTAIPVLVIAWSYRMWERWVLDGNYIMNCFAGTRPPHFRQSIGSMVCSAIFSPTAVLHTLTGITLLASYVHVQSLDSCLLQLQEYT